MNGTRAIVSKGRLLVFAWIIVLTIPPLCLYWLTVPLLANCQGGTACYIYGRDIKMELVGAGILSFLTTPIGAVALLVWLLGLVKRMGQTRSLPTRSSLPIYALALGVLSLLMVLPVLGVWVDYGAGLVPIHNVIDLGQLIDGAYMATLGLLLWPIALIAHRWTAGRASLPRTFEDPRS